MSTIPAPLAAALADRYRLERELGQGGMATVYLAEDLKHDRKVAIKVLRPELAATMGPERFAREIAVAARLQHPHILGLLDSGETDGFFYYVMPFVEGETLRDRLARTGELPVPEAVRLLTEIADALAVAHKAGVVHRDIKPENILLSGRHAMVMDFGIAKAVTEASGREKLTTAGVALGTPAYMAPEQAAAEPTLDHRVDIYAIGVMGYELLTGQTPFIGGTAQQILAAQVTRTPEPIARHRPALPPALAAAIMKCLEKRPADRYQSADELVAVLEPLAAPSGSTAPTTMPPVAGARRRFAVPALIATLVLVLGAVSARLMLPRPLTLTTLNAIAVTSAPGIEYQPALSPDGSQVAFVAQRDGRHVLSVRSTVSSSGGEIRPAEATPGTQQYPSWSPDGEFIRFYSCIGEACLWRAVGRLGGAAQIVELPRQTPWTAWSRDGARAAFLLHDSIFVYTAADRSTRLLALLPGPQDQHSLAWSPDGRWIAYVNSNSSWPDSPNTQNSSIWIVATANGKRVAVTAEDHLNVSPVWLDANHLLFISNRDGAREVYLVEVGSVGLRGDPQKVAGGTDAYSLSLTADGRRLAVAKVQVRQNIWAYAIRASGSMSARDGRPVTSGTQVVEGHDVSPDGEWLVYDSNLRGNADIYKRRLDGGESIPLVTGPTDAFGPVWSPDGREVAFFGGPGVGDVFVVSAEGGTPVQLTDAPAVDGFARWSPDGLRITFASDRTGRFEVWLLARARVGGPWREAVQLTDFGCVPYMWAPDGSGVLCSTVQLQTLVLVSAVGAVLWRRDLVAAGFSDLDYVVFAENGLSLYLAATRGGRRGVWTWPLDRGEPRLLVGFDDPLLAPLGFISVHGHQLYLTVAQNESDIWVMDLKR
jgi:serine/threonine-protein kinase